MKGNFLINLKNLKNKKSTIISGLPFSPRIKCGLEDCNCRSNNFIWISEDLKAIYFETPKTACTSIKKALDISSYPEMAFRASAKLLNQGLKASYRPKFFIKEQKSKIEEQKKQIKEGQAIVNGDPGKFKFAMLDMEPDEVVKKYDGFFVFTVVRSPLSRILSCYKMFCRSNNKLRKKQTKKLYEKDPEDINLKEFIQGIKKIKNHHWQPYTEYLPSDLDKIKVIKLEELEKSWPEIAKRLKAREELERKNETGDMKIEADDEDRKIIKEIYKKDLINFNYNI